jgi:uncharacterized protein (TIGR00106 family)
LMEFSIVPLDKGASLSEAVASILDIVDQSGLDYRLTPMGTVVEGEWEALSSLLDACFQSIHTVSDRVIISVKYDYRKGQSGRLQSKIESVEKQLGRKLKTS